MVDEYGRCRLCRESKAAYDAGLSYGAYKGRLYIANGDMPELPAEFYRVCPFCKKVFLPRRKNQIYDTTACAQRVAIARYNKRRAGHRAPALKTEEQHGADITDQICGRVNQDESGTQDQAVRRISNSPGEKADDL